MLYGLYLSAAGMKVQEYRQEVFANNLANAQTAGFKRDLAMVMSRENAAYEDPSMARYRVPVLSDQGGGVWLWGTGVDTRQADVEKTGRQMDVAIEGTGYLTVAGSPGTGEGGGGGGAAAGEAGATKLVTRDGRLIVNTKGELVLSGNGRAVLDKNGQTIKLDQAFPVEISKSGEIKQGGEVVGQLGLVDVDSKDLRKAGESLLEIRAGAETKPADASTAVRQGFIENSGVDPITEMTSMLEGQRVFDANAKMLQFQDQMLAQLSTVGRVA